MADRAHSTALAAHKKFLADQDAERARLAAELAERQAAYEAWVSPKNQYERLKNDVRQFERQHAALAAEITAQVAAAAPPRISETVRALNVQLERVTEQYAIRKPGRKPNAEARDAEVRGIRAAIDKVNELVFVEHDDAAIDAILAQIPRS